MGSGVHNFFDLLWPATPQAGFVLLPEWRAGPFWGVPQHRYPHVFVIFWLFIVQSFVITLGILAQHDSWKRVFQA